jgi:hypothetical protein
METSLHVLNGDATFQSFEDTGIDGDTLIWREVLSEGPLMENISSAAFWSLRSDWICKTFKETPADYQQAMIDQLGLLNQNYGEIYLWFDFDLHCQVNLLAVMMLIKQHNDLSGPVISLITDDDFSTFESFRGMGQLGGDQLSELFDNRRTLTPYDFELAAQAWNIYITGEAEPLKKLIAETPFWGSMHRLKPALEAHLKRLETNFNGLNFIEQALLDIINRGIKQPATICHVFGESHKIYGMGNAEIDIYLGHLKQKGLFNF